MYNAFSFQKIWPVFLDSTGIFQALSWVMKNHSSDFPGRTAINILLVLKKNKGGMWEDAYSCACLCYPAFVL